MIKNNKIKVLLLSIFLIILSFIIIVIKGNTYTLNINLNNKINNINDINIVIEQDKEVIKYTNKSIDNNKLILVLESINKGEAYLIINNKEDNIYSDVFYVHNFNIITKNEYFGKSNGDIIIPISIIILISYILILFINKYKQSIKINIYQYKNIAYLGIIIFLIMFLINQIYKLSNYNGFIDSINDITNSVTSFSILLLPIAFILSILVTISNINLIRKEGFSIKNILGFLLGLFICLLSILPEIMYRYTFYSTFINIHNMSSIDYYIYTFIETLIYLTVAYLECILLGTIIISIKATKKEPKYNKDYIIILGCMIKKDGSLTPLLKGRVDKAINFAKLQKEKTNKDIIFVPSGGKGNNEIISESLAIKNYLIEQGIKEKNILVEDKSTSTYENIKFSNELIKKHNKNANIILSTTNYHVFRAGIIATEQGLLVDTIGSKTKSYFWINAFIREFIATLYSEKKKHITIILITIIIIIIMMLLIYISNIY